MLLLNRLKKNIISWSLPKGVFMDFVKLRERMLKNKLACVFLAFCAFIYGLIVRLILLCYEKNIFKSNKAEARVVCIGNITAGGTGKTTAVLLAAQLLSKAGIKTAIISRGYKRDKKEKVKVLFDNDLLNWQETGDEPYMMSQMLAEYKVPVAVASNRYEAAKEIIKEFKSDILLLDDGFQHHKLQRDANIVLINARDPFGNGKMLPYGILREPLCALKRASLVILTHSNLATDAQKEEIKEKVKSYNKDLEILEAIHKPDYFYDVINRAKMSLEDIKGEVVSFCGLGDPASFEQILKNLGLKIKQTWRFKDHNAYTLQEIESLDSFRQGLPLITTFKDYVKFPKGWRDVLKNKIYILAINLEIKEGNEVFLKTLKGK